MKSEVKKPDGDVSGPKSGHSVHKKHRHHRHHHRHHKDKSKKDAAVADVAVQQQQVLSIKRENTEGSNPAGVSEASKAALKKLLDHCLHHLQRKDANNHFAFPVKTSDAPGSWCCCTGFSGFTDPNFFPSSAPLFPVILFF
jgi:hypothetical protein